MKRIHMPHPRDAARRRREQREQEIDRIRRAVRKSGLTSRTPQTYDAWANDGRPS